MKKNLSIIIPVLNECESINHAIDHIRNLHFSEKIEIIVVDGSPHGKTINVISDPSVKKLIASKGRGSQMNKGACNATCDILLFLHADTYLHKDALTLIGKALGDKGIIGGAFDLEIRSRKKIFRLIEKLASLRSRITRIPYGDQGIFIRREFFRYMGGYENIPIMEDVDLMRRIKKIGRKITFISQKIQTLPRRWEKEGVLYCTLRNWILIMLYFSGVSPARLSKYYNR